MPLYYLRFHQLKPKQSAAVKAFIEGKDVFVSLLTDYRKSAIFPIIYDKIRGEVHEFNKQLLLCTLLQQVAMDLLLYVLVHWCQLWGKICWQRDSSRICGRCSGR